MNTRRFVALCALSAALCILCTTWAGGPLSPPAGPVADTPGPEPRIAIQSLPGDASALHIISQPGSYYLEGNIKANSAIASNGILVNADGPVTIDGRGFSMTGMQGDGAAILIGLLQNGLVVIANVEIEGWDYGIQVAQGARTHTYGNITLKRGYISESSVNGILAVDSVVNIDESTIQGCGQDGVVLGDHSFIADSFFNNNGRYGVWTANEMVLKGSKIKENFVGAVWTGTDAVIQDCLMDGTVRAGNCSLLQRCDLELRVDDSNFIPVDLFGGDHRLFDNHFDITGSNSNALPAVQVSGDNVVAQRNIFNIHLVGAAGSASTRNPPHFTSWDGTRHHVTHNTFSGFWVGTEAIQANGAFHRYEHNYFAAGDGAAAGIIGNASQSMFVGNSFFNLPAGEVVVVTGADNYLAPVRTQTTAVTTPHPQMNVVIEPRVP